MKLSAIANAIAAKGWKPEDPEDDVNERWHALRDHVDGWTGGELDCWQLDKLTDMVERRLMRMADTA